MSRANCKEFEKTIHHAEFRVADKWVKVGIKMRFDSDANICFSTDHFKNDDGRPVKNEFKTLPELYAAIEDQLTEMPEVTWEPKIFIEVKGWSYGRLKAHPQWDGETIAHSSLDIEARAIEFGAGSDGRRWSRNPPEKGERKQRINKFEHEIGYGHEKKTWHKADEDGTPYSRALIDDTPENRKMLVAFSVKFDELRDQFFRAFAPETVYRFLSSTANTLLLNTGENNETNA